METKEITLNNFIDKAYYNFKEEGKFEDYNNDELTKMFLLESKNDIIEIIYANRKSQKQLQNDKLKKLFKNISILAKINDINLVD